MTRGSVPRPIFLYRLGGHPVAFNFHGVPGAGYCFYPFLCQFLFSIYIWNRKKIIRGLGIPRAADFRRQVFFRSICFRPIEMPLFQCSCHNTSYKEAYSTRQMLIVSCFAQTRVLKSNFLFRKRVQNDKFVKTIDILQRRAVRAFVCLAVVNTHVCLHPSLVIYKNNKYRHQRY